MVSKKVEFPLLERSSKEVFRENDPNHGSGLLKGLHRLYKDQRYCDVTLSIGEKRKLRAHRVVLASFSDYFESLLGPNWEEGKQDEVDLSRFDERDLNDLIEFAYTGNVDIGSDNVETLLEAANYLGVEFVQNACIDFLMRNVNNNTCLGILHLADFLSFKDLKKLAKRHSLRRFAEVCKEQEFLRLPYDLLIELLQDDELCVVIEDHIPCIEEREKVVLQAVFRYVTHDKENRRNHLPELLSLVRLPTLAADYLEEIRSHDLVSGSNCSETFKKALKLKVEKPESFSGDSKWASPREFAELEIIWGRSFANGGQIQPETNTFCDLENLTDDVFINGLKLWIRRWDGRPVLGGLRIFYSNGKEVTYGGDTAQEHYEFHLGENEKIVKVNVQSGWMIDRLSFYTNKRDADGRLREYGPYGGGGGGFYSECPAGSYGYLVGVSGSEVQSQGELGITRLQFAWKTYVFPGDPKPPQGRCRVDDELEDSYSDYSNDALFDDMYDDFDDLEYDDDGHYQF